MKKDKSEIETYLHCKRCLDEMPEGVSPKDYQRVQVGITKDGLVRVWCVRHDMEVATLDKPTIEWLRQSRCAVCGTDHHH